MFPKLAPYHKAVVAGLTALLALVSAVLGLTDVIPAPVSAWLVGASAVLNTGLVWLVRNRVAITGDVDGDGVSDLAVEKLGTRVGKHSA